MRHAVAPVAATRLCGCATVVPDPATIDAQAGRLMQRELRLDEPIAALLPRPLTDDDRWNDLADGCWRTTCARSACPLNRFATCRA